MYIMRNKEIMMNYKGNTKCLSKSGTKWSMTKYFESTGCKKQVSFRMMEYLGHVIDTPTVGALGNDNGKAPDVVIGEKMKLTKFRVGDYRRTLEMRFTKTEVLELCEEVMKEVA